MQRVLEVEHATFTPLVLGTNGRNDGMGEECSRFVSELANKPVIKTSWIRTKLSF